MITTHNPETYQLQLADAETDSARLQRLDWQRAIDANLHALRDYVHADQLLIWQPGRLKRGRGDAGYRAFDVQLATSTSCTCSRFKLRDRCEHIAFAKQLEASGMMPDTDMPVRAGDVEEKEAAA